MALSHLALFFLFPTLMPLKIIHHTETMPEKQQKGLDLDVEDVLQKMFYLCSKVVEFSQGILNGIDFEEMLRIEDEEEFQLQYNRIIRTMNIFALIFGKRIAIMDAVAKATNVMQKLQVLADKFGVQIVAMPEDIEDEVLDDDDIEMMVQMVKDFGADKIREDVAECREKLEAEKEQNKSNNILDVYDVYKEEPLDDCDENSDNNVILTSQT